MCVPEWSQNLYRNKNEIPACLASSVTFAVVARVSAFLDRATNNFVSSTQLKYMRLIYKRRSSYTKYNLSIWTAWQSFHTEKSIQELKGSFCFLESIQRRLFRYVFQIRSRFSNGY